MAKAGVLRYEALSDSDAEAFLNGDAVLQHGHMLYVESGDSNDPMIYFGVGRPAASTPSMNVGILDRISVLEGAGLTPPPWPISYVTNLQTALDSKAALVHSHAISDVTGLQAALDAVDAALAAAYEPGVTAVDEGTFGV